MSVARRRAPGLSDLRCHDPAGKEEVGGCARTQSRCTATSPHNLAISRQLVNPVGARPGGTLTCGTAQSRQTPGSAWVCRPSFGLANPVRAGHGDHGLVSDRGAPGGRRGGAGLRCRDSVPLYRPLRPWQTRKARLSQLASTPRAGGGLVWAHSCMPRVFLSPRTCRTVLMPRLPRPRLPHQPSGRQAGATARRPCWKARCTARRSRCPKCPRS